MGYPTEEGGLGIRQLSDISKSFIAKLWRKKHPVARTDECCENYCNENLEHLFKRNNFSKNIWNVFRNQFGLEEVGGGINQEMMIWKARCKKRPKLKILITSWTFPPSSMIKLNTDGCSKGNPEGCGGGGIFKENGINMIIVDLDSSLVISWVTGKMKPPWNLRHNIDTIQNTITTFDEFHISHCYREANKEANVLAKEGSVLENVKWYSSYQELPKQARGICYMDKHQFVSFKIRGSNSSFIFDDNG
ncbi:hypothetical protein KY290_017875 [Solanum tuberosum]|uniref:RNase H type-1 domain-containing protein n=1 Tax=Solanum tuberosum TaxID=4113 RepID=A0ABQ7VCK2_SOLTU|nr:hypothetical protein KY290_017875 [Solanum tuberosum]